MIFDTITIIVCGVVILMSIITPLCNPFFRFRKKRDDKEVLNPLPPVTIIVTTHDDAEALDNNLSLILAQDYPAEYQVVVVTMDKHDSECVDVIKKYSNNDKLYSTYVPTSSRYMSREKLAITIGVKAAKHEWIILINANCAPISDGWLSSMASNFADNKNLVIGYTKQIDSNSYTNFDKLRTFSYIANESLRNIAYRTNSENLAFRKSEFMNNKGFQGNLNLIRGEYDFIVNKYAQQNSTVIELSPESWLSKKQSYNACRNANIFYLETRKYLDRSFSHRARFNFDMLMMYFNYIIIVAALSYSIPLHNWIITSFAGLALIITIILRIVFAKKVIDLFDEAIPLWTVIPNELSIIPRNIVNIIRYKFANKYDFTTHKI